MPGAPACPPSRDDSRRNTPDVVSEPLHSWSGSGFNSAMGSQANHKLWRFRVPLPDVAPSCPPLTPIYRPTLVESPRGVNCASPALSFAPQNKACPGEIPSPCFSEDIQVQRRGVPCPQPARLGRQQDPDFHSVHLTEVAQTPQNFPNSRHSTQGSGLVP